MYNRTLVFTAVFMGILMFGVGITTLGSIAPWLKMRFIFTDIQTGALFSILPGGILAGSLLFGTIADRYGYKYLLIGCCLLMAAGFRGIATTHSLAVLKFSVFLFGMGGGAMNGATSAAVSDMSESAKAANLSLLGLFFGIGTLGMPFLFGTLNEVFTYSEIIAGFGWFTLAIAGYYTLLAFPPPKPAEGIVKGKFSILAKDRFLVLVAFFLFCQSSFEGIMNNWTTTYLIKVKSIDPYASLYGLSFFLAGYTVTRLVLGTALRNINSRVLLYASILLSIIGTLLLSVTTDTTIAAIALVLLGAGLSGGFPLMLGLVGERYRELSGTAFSFVLVIALIGNMLVNYLVGVIAEKAGIQHLVIVAFTECAVMLLLALLVFREKEVSAPL